MFVLGFVAPATMSGWGFVGIRQEWQCGCKTRQNTEIGVPRECKSQKQCKAHRVLELEPYGGIFRGKVLGVRGVYGRGICMVIKLKGLRE